MSRYNFSRRLIDHRVHADFASDTHISFSPGWFQLHKQRITAFAIENPGLLYSMTALMAVFTIPFIDYWVKQRLYPEGDKRRSQLERNERGSTSAEKYLMTKNDHTVDLGKWNTLFRCWEKSPNCGRDFDVLKDR
jgi:hypothetical protein